jgi:ribosome maturation factor RimP
MIRKENIVQLATDFLRETDRYLVKVSVGKDNRINVFIDGDNGVKIEHCVQLSRYIEDTLDRESEDFELNVSSTGVGEPFVMLRQYQGNIGKTIRVLLNDGSTKTGILKYADEKQIELTETENKKHKKAKKMTTGGSLTILMSEVKTAKAIVVF